MGRPGYWAAVLVAQRRRKQGSHSWDRTGASDAAHCRTPNNAGDALRVIYSEAGRRALAVMVTASMREPVTRCYKPRATVYQYACSSL